MSKMTRIWEWLLPGLISLSPMGALAYYVVDAPASLPEPPRVVPPVLVAA